MFFVALLVLVSVPSKLTSVRSSASKMLLTLERAWYQREDGRDWRVQDDGSVIVTLSATGDVTICGDTR